MLQTPANFISFISVHSISSKGMLCVFETIEAPCCSSCRCATCLRARCMHTYQLASSLQKQHAKGHVNHRATAICPPELQRRQHRGSGHLPQCTTLCSGCNRKRQRPPAEAKDKRHPSRPLCTLLHTYSRCATTSATRERPPRCILLPLTTAAFRLLTSLVQQE